MTDSLVVLHAREVWLARTETWLAGLVRSLDPYVVNHVTCRRRENVDEFSFERVRCEADEPAPGRLSLGLRGVFANRRDAHALRVLREVRPRILHSHFAFEGYANRRLARAAGAAHVVSCYGLDISRFPVAYPAWRGRYRALFRLVDRVLCEGPAMAEKVAALGCPRERITVHALGVDVARISFKPPEWVPSDPLRILIAASFREKKGIPDAIAAAGVLNHKRPVEVTVIGAAGSDAASQQEKQRIEAAAQASGLGSRLRFLGSQPHHVLFEEAARHHVFLQASRTASDGDDEGGAPVAVIEMAAAGLPVVSTRHCDLVSVIKDGVTGLLAPERDVAALVDRLEVLAGHPERWRGMVEAARRHVEADYDVATQGRRLASLYRELAVSGA